MKQIVLLLFFWHANGAVMYDKKISLPINAKEQIQACKDIGENQDVPVEDLWQVELACLVSFYNNLPRNDLSEQDTKPFIEARERRFGFRPPRTGFRTRRDLRTLTSREWDRTVKVFVQMYKDGTFRAFGRLHSTVEKSAHRGAAFLVWHRVFLTHFEEEMRKIDPDVSLPYWDYSADFYIPKPTDSVVWSDCFFGSDKGALTGHFSGFYGAHYSFVSRNANADYSGKLINLEDVDNLLQFCSFSNITTGKSTDEEYQKMEHNIELHHDEVHDWVGGDMGRVPNSAFDPAFYMHHAYIDYIFEEFRQHQVTSCKNVDIESDYRRFDDLCRSCSESDRTRGHGPNEKMQGYPDLRNIDGLWSNWTTVFYEYEPRPSCPDNCKGEYFHCNTTYDPKKYPYGICVTKTKDACKNKLLRSSRSMDNEVLLKPTVSCSATGRKFEVIKGDGRIRRLSVQESWKKLQQYLGRHQEAENDCKVKERHCESSKDTITALSFVVSVESLALVIILIYTCFKKNKHNISKRWRNVIYFSKNAEDETLNS